MGVLSQGEGWPESSDDKWYPAEKHPDHRLTRPEPEPESTTATEPTEPHGPAACLNAEVQDTLIDVSELKEIYADGDRQADPGDWLLDQALLEYTQEDNPLVDAEGLPGSEYFLFGGQFVPDATRK